VFRRAIRNRGCSATGPTDANEDSEDSRRTQKSSLKWINAIKSVIGNEEFAEQTMSKNPDNPPGESAKRSGADYPVDPAERISQEARLRKAAAAGMNFPKSPIAALMPRAGSAPASQPLPAVQAAEAFGEQNGPVLQSRQETAEILVELKKIAAWAELQRKVTKWMFVVLAIFVLVGIGFGLNLEQRLKTNLQSTASLPSPDWYDVARNIRSGEFEKAIALGESLIERTPQDPEAHQRLADAYLVAGNLDKARDHYAEAFRLFPSDQNEKLLNAIEKRMNADKQ
jgi:tetratricopeptide (TPR) repeat protein